jgi:hypothetical protein
MSAELVIFAPLLAMVAVMFVVFGIQSFFDNRA